MSWKSKRGSWKSEELKEEAGDWSRVENRRSWTDSTLQNRRSWAEQMLTNWFYAPSFVSVRQFFPQIRKYDFLYSFPSKLFTDSLLKIEELKKVIFVTYFLLMSCSFHHKFFVNELFRRISQMNKMFHTWTRLTSWVVATVFVRYEILSLRVLIIAFRFWYSCVSLNV